MMVGMTAPAPESAVPQGPSTGNAATFHDWWQAARPHTWPNAIAPVVAGTGAAALYGQAHIGRALLALIVSWALIVGVNYANDYSDGIRGTDEGRTGPTRLTASGLARPEEVKLAAYAAFALAAVVGLILTITAGAWWLIIIGAACILAAWFYTGGEHPYGYAGFGELAVFVFFGLVAVMGTEFVQSGFVSWEGFLLALGVGAISASVNLANNIRDIPTDAAAGKRTLAVRIGDEHARTLFCVLTLVPFIVSVALCMSFLPSLAGLAALPLAVASILVVRRGAQGADLIPVLGMNGRAMLAWALISALAFAFGGAALGRTVPYEDEPSSQNSFLEDPFAEDPLAVPGDEYGSADEYFDSVTETETETETETRTEVSTELETPVIATEPQVYSPFADPYDENDLYGDADVVITE